MIDEFQFNGLWWLPESPEKKVSGILRFNQTEGPILELIGSLDRANDLKTRRFYITQGGGYKKDCIEIFGETNTGDPKVLEDFVMWGMEKYPANRYALVVWNHGGGWWDEDERNKRNIAYDDASGGDSINNQELQDVLRNVCQVIRIDMDFLELVNKRLDYIKAYNSERHYKDHIYYGRRWTKQWQDLKCSEIESIMIESYLISRARQTSAYTANKELRCLRAMFNFGVEPSRKLIFENPTKGIKFMPVEKKIKYVPPKEDILRVIMAASPDIRDYLWTITLTMGRMSEINRMTWQDVNLDERYVVLYTRKKVGGHLTPRKIPMPDKLHQVLSRRFKARDKSKPWVFWSRYWDAKKGGWSEGPYKDRKRIMKTLCKNAKVRYFRFHAFRHFGASLLDRALTPIGAIQRILGHENRTTTEIYLHSIGESEREAMRIFDNEIEVNPQTNPQTEIKKDLPVLS